MGIDLVSHKAHKPKPFFNEMLPQGLGFFAQISHTQQNELTAHNSLL
jgi:hypothetical protein